MFAKITKNYQKLLFILILSYLLFPLVSQARPVLKITPDLNNFQLKQGTTFQNDIAFTVSNNSGLNIPALNIEADYLHSDLFKTKLTTGNNDCTDGMVLKNNESCKVHMTVTANNILGNATITPRVCGFHGALCSRGFLDFQIIPNTLSDGHFSFSDTQGTPVVNLDLTASQSGTLLLKNKGSIDIGNFSLNTASVPKEFSIQGTCADGSITTLKKGDSCTIVYKVSPKVETSDFVIEANGYNVDNNSEAIKIHVASAGHFAFNGADSKIDLSSSVVAPSEKQTIVLRNNGDSDITDFKLITDTAPQGVQLSGSCLQAGTTLAKNASCTVEIQTNQNPTAGIIQLVATGQNVDNSPQQITVTIASSGHFTLSNYQQETIHALELGPLENGLIILKNTGGTDIKNLKITIPSLQADTISIEQHCPIGGTLIKNTSCEINYETYQHPKTQEFTIHISGDNSDNSPTNLPVRITESGHVVFSSVDGNEITELNLTPKSYGSFFIRNSGGVDITKFTLKTKNLPKSTVLGGDCFRISTLQKKSECNVTYAVDNDAQANESFKISVEGKHADNLPIKLQATIYPSGHIRAQNEGKEVKAIDLGPNDTADIYFQNTGATTINNFSLDIDHFPKDIQLSGTCLGDAGQSKKFNLEPFRSCNLIFKVPAVPTRGNYELTATGENADNSPYAVQVFVHSPALSIK